MPFGPGPVGFIAFVVVKLGGYAGAARMLGRSYQVPTNSWKVGAVRTAIGLAAGTAYFGVWSLTNFAPDPVLWFVGLLPIRVVEWAVLLRLFFEKTFLGSSRSWKYSVYGSAWSYALDFVSVAAAFVIPGGVWVC